MPAKRYQFDLAAWFVAIMFFAITLVFFQLHQRDTSSVLAAGGYFFFFGASTGFLLGFAMGRWVTALIVAMIVGVAFLCGWFLLILPHF
jgi:hypothetical protein